MLAGEAAEDRTATEVAVDIELPTVRAVARAVATYQAMEAVADTAMLPTTPAVAEAAVAPAAITPDHFGG